MKVQFISNSGCLLHLKNGSRVLIDPWITDGIYLGSWIHSPPLKYSYSDIDLKSNEYIYISHVHEDHLDTNFLNTINKQVNVLLPKTKFNFTKNTLTKLGFNKFIELPLKVKQVIIPKILEVIAYDQFTAHPFLSEPGIGNIIDTSCIFTDDETSFFHVNDNKLNKEAVFKFELDKKNIDTIMINYNPAGPYPACFNIPKDFDKEKIARKNGLKCLNNTIEVLKLIKHKTVIPISGNYKISRNLENSDYLNKYLGHIKIEEANKKLIENNCNPIEMDEGDIFDLKNQILIKGKNLNISPNKKNFLPLPYQNKKYPSKLLIDAAFKIALKSLKRRISQFRFSVKTNIEIELTNNKDIYSINNGDKDFCRLKLTIDDRLFLMILNREVFFDDAQIGCHIHFKREPDNYEYDAMTLLQFLHK